MQKTIATDKDSIFFFSTRLAFLFPLEDLH